MERIQQVVPVTDLRLRHVQVFDMLKGGPVVLAQRSRPAAVLVSVDQWDRTADIIEDLTDTVDALRMELAIAKGEAEMMSQEEISEWLAEGERWPAKGEELAIKRNDLPVAVLVNYDDWQAVARWRRLAKADRALAAVDAGEETISHEEFEAPHSQL